jgi:hypothetical protein
VLSHQSVAVPSVSSQLGWQPEERVQGVCFWKGGVRGKEKEGWERVGYGRTGEGEFCIVET